MSGGPPHSAYSTYSAALVRAVTYLAGLVRDEADAASRSDAALASLRTLLPFDCGALVAWNPLSGQHETLANDGYDQRFIDDLHSARCRAEMAGLGFGRRSGPMRICDLPMEPVRIWTVREIIWPAGFSESLSMELYSDWGTRYTGMLHLSTICSRHPSDAQREKLAILGPVLGGVADVAKDLRALTSRVAPDTSVAGLAPDGSLVALPGAGLHTAYAAPSALPEVLADWLAGPRPYSPFLWRWVGCWHTVRVSHAPAGSGLRGIVALRADPDLRELSERELEVLTQMASGDSNEAIAEHLLISAKTVSTHVGHIFEKLGVNNRTRAAVIAVEEGLLLARAPRARPAP